MTEAYLDDIMVNLSNFGASIDDLQNYDGAVRLNLSVPETNMRGFEAWFVQATEGIGSIQKDV